MLLIVWKRSWTFHIAALVFISCLGNVQGESIALSYYPTHAELNGSMSIRCSMAVPIVKDDVLGLYKTDVEGPLIQFALEKGKCHVTKRPPPGYGYYCNFNYTYDHYEYEIHHARVQDRGNYWCMLDRNDFGTFRKLFSRNTTVAVYSATVSLNDSSPLAMLEQSFTFVCTVSDAPHLSGSVDIYRGGHIVGPFTQKMYECRVKSELTSGYTPSCGAANNDPLVASKTYHLKIEKVANVDNVAWECVLHYPEKRSNIIHLVIAFGPYNISLTPASPIVVQEGTTLTVKCLAECNPSCNYSWNMAGEEVAQIAAITLNINRNMDKNVYICTVTNSVIVNSVSKFVVLKVTQSQTPERMFADPDVIALMTSSIVLVVALPITVYCYRRMKKSEKHLTGNLKENVILSKL